MKDTLLRSAKLKVGPVFILHFEETRGLRSTECPRGIFICFSKNFAAHRTPSWRPVLPDIAALSSPLVRSILVQIHGGTSPGEYVLWWRVWNCRGADEVLPLERKSPYSLICPWALCLNESFFTEHSERKSKNPPISLLANKISFCPGQFFRISKNLSTSLLGTEFVFCPALFSKNVSKQKTSPTSLLGTKKPFWTENFS